MDQPAFDPQSTTVELTVTAAGSERRREPVTCGVPWPRGLLPDLANLRLCDEEGRSVPLQARALDRWPGGSVRWSQLDWQAEVRGSAAFRLTIASEASVADAEGPRLRTEAGEGEVHVDTGAARFHLRTAGPFPFDSVLTSGAEAADAARTRFVVEDESGHVYEPVIRRLEVEESGPLRTAVLVEGDLARPGDEPLLHFIARLHFFAGSAAVRFVLTLRNPRKADHPGGLWDLGNGGSVYLRDASLTLALPPGQGHSSIRCSPEVGAPFATSGAVLELYQDSSGGENWRSHNHLNRKRVVPHTFRGYRLRQDGSEQSGFRATPAVVLTRGARALAVTSEYFWQNFPKALEATADSLTLRLFPRQSADFHEIQGGEQKTHEFTAAFGPDPITDEPLSWARQPAEACADPAWYCAAGVMPYLTPRADDPHREYLQLVDAAVEGGDTFERKREVIDEYGWRHFGDIYGDHEAVFHKGPKPLISHYNNQYDPLAGLGYQFMRSGDLRWRRLMRELAAHVIDIDVYHTDRDKSAYNQGLFWHTFHYVDADTGTHRSYPKAAKVCGGGPANEQNYTTGLMLHYFLTGDPLARETAVGLAQWVIDRDDGSKTPFRWLAGGATGLASSSRTPSYHGPGRGAANSVLALLDGHRLTGEARFLAKAEELIRRCIHPSDDVPARNLLDAENRWFYTMFLQALGRYLDYKAELGQLDFLYAYARVSLLHYARWMAEYEYPYLEKPDILEYPTETWAAQDMRKSEVFDYAAMHTTGSERKRFRERAAFFFRYSTGALSGMPTRTLCRPVALLLSYGFQHAYFLRHPDASASPPSQTPTDFGRPEVFVPQKARAKKRLVLLAGAAIALLVLGVICTAVYCFAP
jgi:YetA-like protein